MKIKRSFRRAHSGFTLIEIMVVVVIIATLAALVVPNVIEKADQAKVTKAQSDIRAIEAALNMYRLDNSRYPGSDQGLQALITPESDSENSFRKGGYLAKKKIPVDPWGNEYQYLSPGEHGDIDVFSYGADGQSGGAGTDADIGNWDL